MLKKIGIIGAGISGISLANMLCNKGHKVQVFEKSTKPGGLVKCDVIDGVLFHRVGGHVFNSKNTQVLNWFWDFFDKDSDFIKADRNAKILLSRELLEYPIENSIYRFERGILEEILHELIELKTTSDEEPENFEEFLLLNFGETLYKLYFKPYNEKIWNCDLKQVPLDWLEGKLPMPNLYDILLSNIQRTSESDMVHSKFYYPKKGGSQFIVDTLSESIDIKCDTEVSSIEYSNNHWTVNDSFVFDAIVFTGDVRELTGIIKGCDENWSAAFEEVKTLQSNGTSNLLCETDKTDLSWLYLPEKNCKAHRIIYTGNFSENNNAINGRKTCTIEFSGKVDQAIMVEEIKKLPGNITVLDMNYEKNSYVIQDKQTREKIDRIKAIGAEYNFFLLGRFAEWEYYNMDKAIENAMKLSQRMF